MAVVRCKAGVRFDGFTKALVAILAAVVEVAADTIDPPKVIISSGSEGQHLPKSRHYTFEALDLRTGNFPTRSAVTRFADRLRRTLGPAYTVLDEGDHLHAQPRKGT